MEQNHFLRDTLITSLILLILILVGYVFLRPTISEKLDKLVPTEQVQPTDTIQWCEVFYDGCRGLLSEDRENPGNVRYVIQDPKTCTNFKMSIKIRAIDNFDSVRVHAQEMHEHIVRTHVRNERL